MTETAVQILVPDIGGRKEGFDEADIVAQLDAALREAGVAGKIWHECERFIDHATSFVGWDYRAVGEKP